MISINRIYSRGEFHQNATHQRNRSRTPPQKDENTQSDLRTKEDASKLRLLRNDLTRSAKVGDKAEFEEQFDILKVREVSTPLNRILLDLQNNFSSVITREASFQSLGMSQPIPRLKSELALTTKLPNLVFSDEVRVLKDPNPIICVLIVVSDVVFLLYKESQKLLYSPFNIRDIECLVLSKSNPLIGAIQLKEWQAL